MRTHRAMAASGGFTLLETLAAFAILSVIIVSAGLLLHDGVFFFDRGTGEVDQQEQLSLALDSLRKDFGAARFVVEDSGKTRIAAFTADGGGDNGPARVTFITGSGQGAGVQGLEVVSLTVETLDSGSQLVRRRAAWPGPEMHLAEAHPGDAVVLAKGSFDISFSFSELEKDGELVWLDNWTGEAGLPHSVRMVLRDISRSDLAITADFPIHADAPAACSTGDVDCLSLAAAASAQPPGQANPAQGVPTMGQAGQ